MKLKAGLWPLYSAALCILLLGSTLLQSAIAAPHNTPNYYKCYNRVGGDWNFGRVPYACDVNPWGDPEYVKQKFPTLMFNDQLSRTAERKRYTQEGVQTCL